MNPLRLILGALAAHWRFVGLTLSSSILFLVWLFPFSDLSDLVTTVVARATGNQIFVQTEKLDLHFVPQPAISASQISIETSMPLLEAKWVKVTPGIFTTLLNLGTFMKASSGDPEASRQAMSKVSLSIDAEGVLGADVDMAIAPGKKSEQGHERSRLTLEVENLDLAKAQSWAELSLKMKGEAEFSTDMLLNFDFSDQPEGDFNLKFHECWVNI